jgi:hypothetical protein
LAGRAWPRNRPGVATGALFRLPIRRTSERLAGNLWITEEAEREDTIIAYGQSFVLDRPGLSLVTALGGHALVVVQPGRVFGPNPLRHAA